MNVPWKTSGCPATAVRWVAAQSACQSPGQPSSDCREPARVPMLGTGVWSANARWAGSIDTGSAKATRATAHGRRRPIERGITAAPSSYNLASGRGLLKCSSSILRGRPAWCKSLARIGEKLADWGRTRVTLVMVAERTGVSKSTAGYVLTGQDQRRPAWHASGRSGRTQHRSASVAPGWVIHLGAKDRRSDGGGLASSVQHEAGLWLGQARELIALSGARVSVHP